MPTGLALIVYKLVSMETSIADEIVPIGLALIVYMLVSMLTSIAQEIVPIGLAWIFYKLVSGLTSIAQEIVPIGLAVIKQLLETYEVSNSSKLYSGKVCFLKIYCEVLILGAKISIKNVFNHICALIRENTSMVVEINSDKN